MQNQKTSAITHGAITATIFIVLLLVVLYAPFISLVATLFIPLPFLVHMLRYGWKSTLLVGAVASVITLIITPLAVILAIMATTVGGVMGYFYAHNKGTFAPVIGGTITYLANYLLTFVLMYAVLDINLMQAIEEYVNEIMAMTEGTANFLQLPMSAEQLEMYRQSVHLLPYLFPSVLILSSMAIASLNHIVNRPILRRLGHPIEALPPFREWTFPKSLLFYYFIVLLAILLGFVKEPGTATFVIVMNIQPILEVLLFIQGLAVIAYFGHQRNMGKALLVVTIILTLLFSTIVMMIVRLLGLFELGMGLRKRMKA